MSATQRIELKGNNIMFNFNSFKEQVMKEYDLGNSFKKVIERIEEYDGEEKVEELERSLREIDSILKEKRIRIEAAENYLNYINDCISERRKEKDERLNELRKEVSLLKGEGGIKRKKKDIEEPIKLKRLNSNNTKKERIESKDENSIKNKTLIKTEKSSEREEDEEDEEFILNERMVKKYEKMFEENEVETIKDNVKYLMTWVEMNKMRILYDSVIDGSNYEVIFDKIKKKPNIYVIIIDNNDNVFGGFISHSIKVLSEKEEENIDIIEDNNHFVFCLYPSNDERTTMRWIPKDYEEDEEQTEDIDLLSYGGDIKIWSKNEFIISIGNFYRGWIDIASIGENCSYNHSLYMVYQGMNQSCCNGDGTPFSAERILIVQMGK
ncbi:hypothetical protein EHI8A_027010 [Entamoeba histolytica HM-1:IMSS-B]|uniref:TLDc domain-containing protein n=6 Tax=Entamoeba histolytica TaxID=5759 RepID=C4M8T9_ENTH1|nr:hypothetical protein EHI_143810 [Entamoeba histolytica HM-1:IMSS]EMD43484.1 Hypothetical protein EHI5A_054790 [Entamoeba histolytica KU27]EMH77308.1 hypothetical protein EHI8A_027010 [Entamoeba histolytica HM-1:IMSS-B]ENY61012.1 hypothetical protein EHI7A_029790 [Entamoeba histolytica HM-1:IMSS-A]GAT98037.1 hypothetical protein CL6EHI_143810 [Entamoeba histolytica]EAL45041.1 hypothetical protein EHI_143810 [Entamoeba histolytica HM-1:IMSS]|eukprot:XP_650427.1 hypothetical protein EHI_143810 [Entamoeba histolytica HM-1:IMSS]